MDGEESFEHHGTKGMKWGIRNDKGHVGEQAKLKKISKLDKKFEKNAHSFNLFADIHNAASRKMNNGETDRINNKPQYKNQDFTRDTPLRRKYYKEQQDAFIKALEEAANSMGTNASGTKKYGVTDNGDDSWDVILRDVKHDDSNPDHFTVIIHKDDMGYIKSFEIMDSIAQGDRFTIDFLEHYGVKGMHWGVRTADVVEIGSLAKKAVSFHPDVTKTAFNQKVGQAGGLHSVSDKDLRSMLERMDMERRFSRFMNEETEKRAEGRKATAKMLLKIGKIALPIILGGIATKRGAPIVIRTLAEYQKSIGR